MCPEVGLGILVLAAAAVKIEFLMLRDVAVVVVALIDLPRRRRRHELFSRAIVVVILPPLLVVIDFVVAAVDADSFSRLIIVVVLVVINFIVFVVDAIFFSERSSSSSSSSRRGARWACLGLPSRSLVAARLEGPIWEVRKRPRSAPGLPGPKIVKINKNFIKNTTQELPPARIPESGLPDWSPSRATRFR